MEIVAEQKEENASSYSYLHLPMQSQIALLFIAVMLIFSVLASLLNSWIITNNFENRLDKKAERYIQILSNEYIKNLYHIVGTDFRENLDVIITDKDILSISLHRKNKIAVLKTGIAEEIPDSVFNMIDNGSKKPITLNDKRYYYSSQRLQNVDNNNVSSNINYIVLSFDSNLVFKTSLNAFVWTFFLSMLSAICIMFIAVIVIGKFTKPFNRLSTAMANSQLGQRGVRVEPDGAEEIYKMGLAFNAMISVLERREDRLLSQKSELEDEIRDRKVAELALKNTSSRLQTIFENAIDGIVVVGTDCKVVSINESAEKICGYAENELVGMDFREVMQNMFVEADNGKCGSDGKSIREGNYKTVAVTKSNESIHVELGIRKIKLSGDDNYLVIVRDISQRIESEQELNKYRQHLESMVKEQTRDIEMSRDSAMAGEKAMSTFLSNMSHELRTPMHGVLSFANIALRKIDSVSTDKTKGYLREIRGSGTHLLDIINDLLDLSKLKAGRMLYHYSESSFVDLIEKMNREMSGLAKDRYITFETEVCGDEIYFYFDEKRLMQVLRNLYANAIKFSYSDISIKISADFRQDNKFIFSIFNFGVCVPDDECDAIFDNFTQSSQTATNAGGTGLGLPICKEIVESGHDGKIYVEPGVKNGARFIIEMPVTVLPKGDYKNEAGHH